MRARLSPQDRALTTELVYGVLKQRRRLDHALAAYATRGLGKLDETTLDALRVAAYQLLFLRTPAHAAVDDAVEFLRRRRSAKLGGFANALLRRLSTDGEPRTDDLGVQTSAPDWLVADARARFPAEEARASLEAWNRPSPVWLRVNRRRAAVADVLARLAAERPGARLSTSERAAQAIRVEAGGDPASTTVFAEGLCTPQDVAAQLVVGLCGAAPNERILDACAGVGGKSTYLAELSDDAAHIDAADLSPRKLDLCADLAHRLGHKSIHPVEADLTSPSAALAPTYDRVLLDAPCSGLGVLTRHPEAKWRPRPDTTQLAAIQARLLEALATRVRPGGILVYSVCTFTDEEGPARIAAFLAAHPDFRADAELRTWPHRDDSDAFFAARLVRLAP
jgi:16S rRNA (cytosine967-C5)-methyltransferase